MNKAEPIYDLRGMALRTTATELGIPAGQLAYGVLMDMDFEGDTATLTSFATGDASLYYSTGGGLIGGGEHASVAETAKKFVQLAGEHVQKLEKVESFPRPGPGQVTFYVLTPSAVYAASRKAEELGEDKDSLAPLFHAGHAVITELRQVQPEL